MGKRGEATVQTDVVGRPVLAADSLDLRSAEIALVRDAVRHAETLAAAAATLGISAHQLQAKARRLRIVLPFTQRERRRS